jgi:hypothetical protein
MIYNVIYTPAAEAEAAARAEGWKGEPGSSCWDYVSSDSFERTRQFKTLAAAKRWARSAVSADYYGCVMVEEIQTTTQWADDFSQPYEGEEITRQFEISADGCFELEPPTPL